LRTKEAFVFKHVLAVAVLGFAAVAALPAAGKEVQGIPVGVEAPPIDGAAWFTADGKAPELAGKVYLLHFWFAR
jgi:hypothetical protein